MPRMDGMQMVRELRGTDWGKKIKVIMLTNLNDSENKREAQELMVEEYFVKSDTSLEVLANKVQELLL